MIEEARSKQATAVTELEWLGIKLPVNNEKTRMCILKGSNRTFVSLLLSMVLFQENSMQITKQVNSWMSNLENESSEPAISHSGCILQSKPFIEFLNE